MNAQKSQIYLDFQKFVISLSKTNGRKRKKKDDEIIGLELHRHGMLFAIFASDEVVKKFIQWRQAALMDNYNAAYRIYGEILLAMRKDLYPDTKCKVNDIKNCIGD